MSIFEIMSDFDFFQDHYGSMSMQYTDNVFSCKIKNFNGKIFKYFAQNIEYGYSQSMFWMKNKEK